jgi:hypothetical protein
MLIIFLIMRRSIFSKIKIYNIIHRKKRIKIQYPAHFTRLRRTYYFLQVDLADKIICIPRLRTNFVIFPRLLLNHYYKIPPIRLSNIREQSKIRSRKIFYLNQKQ